MTNWRIHAVLVSDTLPFKEAETIAQHILRKDKIFNRHEGNNYRFRNIVKQRFSKFRSKKVNNEVVIVFGLLKPEFRKI